MKYRTFGNSGIDVSVVGLGTWPLGSDFFGDVDEKAGEAVISKAIDLGINLIDTAPAYGLNFEAEYAVGRALKGRRDKVVISTKFGIHRVLGTGDFSIIGDYTRSLSPTVASRELENSLKRLQTDYIDIYFIHWPDYNTGIDGALELLANWKQEGKIRAGAVSNFSVEETNRAIDKGQISGIQPHLSLFARESLNNGLIPFAEKKNLGVMTYGSLGGGILTGVFKEPPKIIGNEKRATFYNGFSKAKWEKCNKVIDTLREIAESRGVSVPEVAINWVLSQKGVTTALIGTTKTGNLEKNATASNWELDDSELAKIDGSCRANNLE